MPCCFFLLCSHKHSRLLSWEGSFKNWTSLANFWSVRFGLWNLCMSVLLYQALEVQAPFSAAFHLSRSATRSSSCHFLPFASSRQKASSDLCTSFLSFFKDCHTISSIATEQRTASFCAQQISSPWMTLSFSNHLAVSWSFLFPSPGLEGSSPFFWGQEGRGITTLAWYYY